ncbi:hypothetical protein P9D57_18050 [Bacillus sonorensis]|uniref:hypothetical protein n=1 Tax=Bacillus sonorensis TaxID=119858 RepID=UPI002DBFEF46|nr:hypothetical protein [Bacillus sonorensis]MEC1440596.1 hypothetical protein [Bacillus sonorensis]
MAKGLKVEDWVMTKNTSKKGFIVENMGNGVWGVQFISPTRHFDVLRSSQLKKLDSSLNSKQSKILEELYKDLALDTKDWNWLKELSQNSPHQNK